MAVITIVAGVIVSVCNAGAGIAMIAGGAINLCSQLISDRIGHIGRGIGSIIMGIASLAGGYTGICAVIMGILGVSSIALGVNEIATGITGENYMQTLTGMSDEMYGAIFAGVTIATALGNAFFAQCFAEGTLVKTEEGDKKIEEIEVGDKVLSYDEETGKQEYKQVLRLFRNVSARKTTVKIQAEDGKIDEIVSTPGHKYYLPDNKVNRCPDEKLEHASYNGLGIKWVSACDLKKGDRVLLSQNDTLTGKLKYGKVVNAKTEDCEEWTTYNLEVEDFHTYYVGENGVCVHNVACNVNSTEIVDTVDDALVQAEQHLGPKQHYYKDGNYILVSDSNPSKIVRFDIDPTVAHVQNAGAHLNLETYAKPFGTPRQNPIKNIHLYWRR